MPVGRRSWGAFADARLADIGLHDPLTGLPNQSTIAQHLEHELARAQSGAEMVAALYVDLDHFKHVNDALGRAAGDEVLMHVAERIRRTTRGGEVVARLGSDEFVHLCPLARLRDLPVGVLKIDRSFLLDVPRDPQAAAIVEAIASLGRALDMDVVVEGIETLAQLELAERAGCRYAQGYHLAWPLPAAETTARLGAMRDAP